MQRTRIKICGITTLEDALFAISCGVDALGFVFYAKSPRFISFIKAKEIMVQLPPFVSTCGLFVNADTNQIKQAIDAKINLIQFHGDETSEACEQFNFPYIRAIRAKNYATVESAENSYPKASALLIDSFDPLLYGGSGKTFDWSMLPKKMRHKIILAGGLTAENVTQAIAEVQPFAVDVSGGVESQKGIKSHDKIKAFCDAVYQTHG